MFSKINKTFLPAFVVLLISTLACNAPSAAPAAGGPPPVIVPPPQAISTLTPQAIAHINFPTDVKTDGTIFYDVSSKETANEHRAPYGESFRLNRFERPFTQTTMDYLPDIDILYFRLISDNDWHFFFVELNGNNPNNPDQANYGIEIDVDLDGSADYLIWTTPPYTTEWKNENVKIYSDSNHDVGGVSPNQSDAPFTGNGFDTLLFNGGQGGKDPDLAWIRIDPQKANVLQFALKRSTIGSAFMWEAWADAGLRDVSKFSYNDIFTEAQAGSPVRSNAYYPIQSIYAVDNTCRAPVGFDATGNEPLLCDFSQPKPTREPAAGPSPVPCRPAITYVGCLP